MENPIDFSLLKEKIIKTDRVIQMYTKMKKKHDDLKVESDLNMKKLKQILDDNAILKLENECKIHQFEEQKREVENIRTTLSTLEMKYKSLEDEYNQQSSEIGILQCKYQTTCGDLDNCQKSLKKYQSIDNPSPGKQTVKKCKMKEKDDKKDIAPINLHEEFIADDGEDLNRGQQEDKEELNKLKTDLKNYEFILDRLKEEINQLSNANRDLQGKLEDAHERENNTNEQYRKRISILESYWLERENKLISELTEMKEKLEDYKMHECSMKDDTFDSVIVENETLSNDDKSVQIHESWGCIQEKQRFLKGKLEAFQIHKSSKNLSHNQVFDCGMVGNEKISNEITSVLDHEPLENVEGKGSKLKRKLESHEFHENSKKISHQLNDSSSVANENLCNGIKIVPVHESMKNIQENQSLIKNSTIATEVTLPYISDYEPSDNEIHDFSDIFREMRLNNLLSPMPSSEEDVTNDPPVDENYSSPPIVQAAPCNRLDDELLVSDVEGVSVVNSNDPYETFRKLKAKRLRHLLQIKKAKHLHWIKKSRTILDSKQNKCSKSIPSNCIMCDESRCSCNSRKVLSDKVIEVLSDIVIQKLKCTRRKNKLQKSPMDESRSILEVNKMLLEKAKKQHSTLYNSQILNKSASNKNLFGTNREFSDSSKSSETERSSSETDFTRFDSCYESQISNPPSIEMFNHDHLKEFRKVDTLERRGNDGNNIEAEETRKSYPTNNSQAVLDNLDSNKSNICISQIVIMNNGQCYEEATDNVNNGKITGLTTVQNVDGSVKKKTPEYQGTIKSGMQTQSYRDNVDQNCLQNNSISENIKILPEMNEIKTKNLLNCERTVKTQQQLLEQNDNNMTVETRNKEKIDGRSLVFHEEANSNPVMLRNHCNLNINVGDMMEVTDFHQDDIGSPIDQTDCVGIPYVQETKNNNLNDNMTNTCVVQVVEIDNPQRYEKHDNLYAEETSKLISVQKSDTYVASENSDIISDGIDLGYEYPHIENKAQKEIIEQNTNENLKKNNDKLKVANQKELKVNETNVIVHKEVKSQFGNHDITITDAKDLSDAIQSDPNSLVDEINCLEVKDIEDEINNEINNPTRALTQNILEDSEIDIVPEIEHEYKGMSKSNSSISSEENSQRSYSEMSESSESEDLILNCYKKLASTSEGSYIRKNVNDRKIAKEIKVLETEMTVPIRTYARKVSKYPKSITTKEDSHDINNFEEQSTFKANKILENDYKELNCDDTNINDVDDFQEAHQELCFRSNENMWFNLYDYSDIRISKSFGKCNDSEKVNTIPSDEFSSHDSKSLGKRKGSMKKERIPSDEFLPGDSKLLRKCEMPRKVETILSDMLSPESFVEPNCSISVQNKLIHTCSFMDSDSARISRIEKLSPPENHLYKENSIHSEDIENINNNGDVNLLHDTREVLSQQENFISKLKIPSKSPKSSTKNKSDPKPYEHTYNLRAKRKRISNYSRKHTTNETPLSPKIETGEAEHTSDIIKERIEVSSSENMIYSNTFTSPPQNLKKQYRTRGVLMRKAIGTYRGRSFLRSSDNSVRKLAEEKIMKVPTLKTMESPQEENKVVIDLKNYKLQSLNMQLGEEVCSREDISEPIEKRNLSAKNTKCDNSSRRETASDYFDPVPQKKVRVSHIKTSVELNEPVSFQKVRVHYQDVSSATMKNNQLHCNNNSCTIPGDGKMEMCPSKVNNLSKFAKLLLPNATVLRTSGFKQPNKTKIIQPCPASPPVSVDNGDLHKEPVIIPLEKANEMESTKAASLFRKLISFANEEKTVQEVARHFISQDIDHAAKLILEQIVLDTDKPNITNCHAPLMTDTQRIMLGFIVKLENMGMKDQINTCLTKSELRLIHATTLQEVETVSRFYLGICKSHGYIERMRRMCCDAFYFMGDLAVPFLFIVLSSWIELFPKVEEVERFPLVKVLVKLIYMKTCFTPGYNLSQLRVLLEQYYRYPSESNELDSYFEDIFNKYLRNPVRPNDFAILLFCKNNKSQWVIKMIEQYIQPTLEKVKNDNFIATLIILIGNIINQFGKLDGEYVISIRKWLRNIIKEKQVSEVVRQSIILVLHKLPKIKKAKELEGIKEDTKASEK